MTAFNITISERLNLFGGAPSDKWSEYNWNAFLWGEGTNKTLASAQILLTDSQPLTDALTTETQFNRTVSETLAVAGAPSSEVLRDGAGYVYVFPSNATDGEARDPVDWTSGTTAQGSWTSQTAGSTPWS